MKRFAFLTSGLLSIGLAAPPAHAQAWRQTAATLAPGARVLIVGARPEDEDNALIAWLSLGHNIETAYLSVTRGESGVNVAGTELQSALAVVRTAELLAERERDGAHQYFTRAYDFGPTRSDSIVAASWPRDSVLSDMVAVIRAFRPHIVISVVSDTGERDATRRYTARLVRDAYSLSADSSAFRRTRLAPWSVSRLFTLVSLASADGSLTRIDVGQLELVSGRSFAELGADIRRLQRTQPPPIAPGIGPFWRILRLDSSRVGGEGLFGAVDTTWTRFRTGLSDSTKAALDALRRAIDDAKAHALEGHAADSVAVALTHVLKRVADARESFSCPTTTVVRCGGDEGDFALTIERVRVQATNALLGAAGIVIDGTVDRELVAAGDSVPATVTVFNGGTLPVAIRRVAADSRTSLAQLFRDSTLLRPDSVARWSGILGVRTSDLHWWQVNGLQGGTWLHAFAPNASQVISGEDRIPTSATEVTLALAGVDVPVVRRSLVHRDVATVRGDNRHVLTGVTPVSVLLEKTAEYERANIPVDRLFRVFVASSRTVPESLKVTIRLPKGLRADSTTRVAIIPPLGSRNVFFRLRGTLQPGSDSIFATAGEAGVAATTDAAPVGAARPFNLRAYNYGSITHEYPHIPSQQFIRSSKERIESVDLRVPPRLHVAYVKGSDDVQGPLGQLQLDVHALEPSLLSVVDLSFYSTILIGAGALANEALVPAVPSLVEFMRNGGTVVVLPSDKSIATSGLLPFPISFDSVTNDVSDPDAPVRVTDAASQLLTWPNVITAADFSGWSIGRARSIPSSFDRRFRTVLSVGKPGETQTDATLLTAAVGKGVIVYTSLSLDRELNAAHAGAARLFVNLLSAGARRTTTATR